MIDNNEINENYVEDGLYVCPCMGAVANIPIQLKSGCYVGEGGSKLRDELMKKGFKPLRVHSLWSLWICRSRI